MTVTEIASELEGLSPANQKTFNANCEVKIHKVSNNEPTLAVNDLIDEVEGLNSTDFAQLQSLLSNNRKLSQRPC